MSRWFRVSTSIFDHDVFAAEPFTEREAWLWLIAKAAWKETKHRVGSAVVAVPEGSLFITLRELQAAWKWGSDYRVRAFLRLLQKEEMIFTKSNAGKTQISICNYSRYQNPEREEHAKKTHEKRTENALKTPVHQNTNNSEDKSSSLATPRAVLETVLDAERAGAVLDHRKRIGKPLTAHAAKLIAGKFAKCADANAAADAMVANGWQGFEPEWLERRSAPPRQSTSPPPGRKLNYGDLARQRIMGEQDGSEGVFGPFSDAERLPGEQERPGTHDVHLRGGIERRVVSGSA